MKHSKRGYLNIYFILLFQHRVSTILDADKIITLDNGVMVEYGDPQTLMKKEGSVFASLVSADK